MFYYIDDERMPSITAYDPEPNALHGKATGRDERGYMHRVLLRGEVWKVQVKHTMLTDADISKIRRLIGNSRTVRYRGEFGTDTLEFTGYATYKPSLKYDLGGGERYWDCDVSIIED